MPLIRTKALCERGHRLDGCHGPIMQACPYLPTPILSWGLAFILPNLLPSNSLCPTFSNDLQTPFTIKEKKFLFISTFICFTEQKKKIVIIIITLTAETPKQLKSHQTYRTTEEGKLKVFSVSSMPLRANLPLECLLPQRPLDKDNGCLKSQKAHYYNENSWCSLDLPGHNK